MQRELDALATAPDPAPLLSLPILRAAAADDLIVFRALWPSVSAFSSSLTAPPDEASLTTATSSTGQEPASSTGSSSNATGWRYVHFVCCRLSNVFLRVMQLFRR